MFDMINDMIAWRTDEYTSIHKCAFCQHLAEVYEKGLSIVETTVDANACSHYLDHYYEDGVKCDATGNTRVHPSGFITKDNGGGYYIVACPFFEPYKSNALYRLYLNSEAWQKKRKAVLRRDGYKCQMCGAVMNLDVHHVSYENLCNEKLSDLVTLCRECHKKLHKGGRP